MAHGDAREGEVKGKLSNVVDNQYSHATSERGLSSITQADAHTSAASSRLNWHPHRFKWTRPFRGKTKSGFCACAITFRTSYKNKYTSPVNRYTCCQLCNITWFRYWMINTLRLTHLIYFKFVRGYMFRSSLTIIRPVCESCFTNSGYILGSHCVYNFASVYTSYINTLNHTARYRLTVVLQATSQQEHHKHQKRRSPTSSRACPTSTYNSCTIHYSVPRL